MTSKFFCSKKINFPESFYIQLISSNYKIENTDEFRKQLMINLYIALGENIRSFYYENN